MTVKKKAVIYYVICVLAALAGAVYFYGTLVSREVPVNADDTGALVNFYGSYNWGYATGNDYLNIFTLISRIVFSMMSYSMEAALAGVSCRMFFIFLIAGIMACRGKWYYVPFVFYIMAMQGNTNIYNIDIAVYHHSAVLIMLLFFWCTDKFFKEKKTVYLILLGIIAVWGLLQGDFMLVVLYAYLPLAVAYVLNEYKYYKKWLMPIACTVAVAIFLLSMYSKYIATMSYSGYGGVCFATMDELIENIKFYFIGLFGIFNAYSPGNAVVSIDSLHTLLRAGTAIFGGFLCIYNIFHAIKKQQFLTIELICSLSVIFSCLGYVLTGAHENVATMRYCVNILPLFPIVIVRFLETHVKVDFDVFRNKICFAGCFVFLSLSIFEPIHFKIGQTDWEIMAKQLVEKGIDYAVAPYWISSPLTVEANYDMLVQSSTMAENGVIKSYLTEYDQFADYNCYFNCIINDRNVNISFDDQAFGITTESIEEHLGPPVEIITVGTMDAYIYDYDVRYLVKNISVEALNPDLCDNLLIKSKEGIIRKGQSVGLKLNALYPGEYYMEFYGENVEGFVVSEASGQGMTIERIMGERGYIRFRLCCEELVMNADFSFENGNNTDIILEEIIVKTLTCQKDDSVKIYDNTELFYTEGKNFNGATVLSPGAVQFGPYEPLEKGTYTVTIIGANLENATADVYDACHDKLYPIEILERSSNMLIYRLVLEEDLEKAEFRIYNQTGADMEIGYYYITD